MPRVFFGIAILLAGFPWVALAQGDAAIVEDVSGKVPGLQVFDYLKPGTAIKLTAGATLTLGYLKSCSRETITGGTVTIGEDGSTVAGGRLDKEAVKCAEGLQLSAAQASKSGAVVFRRGPGTGKTPAGVPEPSVTVFNTAPAFSLSAPGELIIERLDQNSTTRVFKATGTLFDLRKQNVLLFAGGIYKASLNGKEVIFRISPDASEGSGPLLSRLIRL